MRVKVLTAEQIDDFLHFSCDRSFDQLHDELLLVANTAMRKMNYQSFAQVLNVSSYNAQQVSFSPDQMIAYVQKLQPYFQSQLDYKFLMLQYLHPTNLSVIQH